MTEEQMLVKMLHEIPLSRLEEVLGLSRRSLIRARGRGAKVVPDWCQSGAKPSDEGGAKVVPNTPEIDPHTIPVDLSTSPLRGAGETGVPPIDPPPVIEEPVIEDAPVKLSQDLVRHTVETWNAEFCKANNTEVSPRLMPQDRGQLIGLARKLGDAKLITLAIRGAFIDEYFTKITPGLVCRKAQEFIQNATKADKADAERRRHRVDFEPDKGPPPPPTDEDWEAGLEKLRAGGILV